MLFYLPDQDAQDSIKAPTNESQDEATKKKDSSHALNKRFFQVDTAVALLEDLHENEASLTEKPDKDLKATISQTNFFGKLSSCEIGIIKVLDFL